MQRLGDRAFDEIRPVRVTYGITDHADGSVLYELGKTKVLCTVMLQDGVPNFLKGSKTGWLTAEYAMLPGSTAARAVREIAMLRRDGRSIEISRLIGRSLRSVIDLKMFKDKTIYIDCDVIQADGGTRSAAISGAYCALAVAITKWTTQNICKESPLKEAIAAVSVGLKDGMFFLDPDYKEDVGVEADFNFVMTESGKLVEIQGSTEGSPFAWDLVNQMQQLAQVGIQEMIACRF